MTTMPIISFGAPCECLSAHQRIHPISQRIRVRNLRHLRLGALGVLLASIGLAGNHAHALGFSDALDLAEQHSLRITAQRLQIDASSSYQQAAGALPDPKLSVGIENFPISGMGRFSLTRESMTMQRLALMQEVPNRANRDAQIFGADAKVERERTALGVQRLQIRQELSQVRLSSNVIRYSLIYCERTSVSKTAFLPVSRGGRRCQRRCKTNPRGLQNRYEIFWRTPRRTLVVGGYLDGMAAWRSTIICIICSIIAMRRSI